MSLSSRLTAAVKASCIALGVAVLLSLASSPLRAQEEERRELFTTPPENVRVVWYLQARHVASELELDRQAARSLSRAYASARQEHLDKVKALPETPESMRQFWQLREEAAAALEKSLVEALGEEKGKKAAAALGGFSFFFDHIVADMQAAQRKALAAVFKYQETVNNAVKEARETGSWEGMREKLRAPTVELGKQATLIYSMEQLGEWEEKYGWFFERVLAD